MVTFAKSIRDMSGLSQSEFCSRYMIPIGTYRNWEQGISSPPDYVLFHLYRLVMEDLKKGA